MNYITDTASIKKLMIDKDIKSITELAEQSGITRETLSNILNGNKQPSGDVMRKLVSCLEIEPSDAGCIFFKPDLRNT